MILCYTELHREDTEFHRDRKKNLCEPLWSSGSPLCKFLIKLKITKDANKSKNPKSEIRNSYEAQNMLVPVEWLREYVDFDLSPEALAERLTMAGLEVEEIHDVSGQKVFSTYVTPNRPDLLSVTGVARDISALLATEFRYPKAEIREECGDIDGMAKVDIESPVNCPRYSARVIKDVHVVDSPAWMQERLIAAGMRPINNVVDATNYVLLELGQPLHAFDYDLIADHHIIVRQARPQEKITTIDGEERELNPNMLVIADAKRAVAVAGVMGGFDSEVSSNTRNVLLESANFNRLPIRKTARALQMSSEASFRFERGVDPNLTIFALDRVIQLIQQTGGGNIARGIIDVYPGKVEPMTISIRPERTSKILGFEVTHDQIADYLTRLGMDVVGKDSVVKATVPTFRPDVTREEDLIEEVGRVYGYELLPEKLPVGETTQGSDSIEGAYSARISNILVSAGLQEVWTGSMTAPVEGETQVVIRNPLSDDLSRLRSNLFLDILNVISYNSSRGIRDISIFEIGRVFESQDDSLVVEKLSVAAALTGSMWGQTWNVDRSSLDVDFFFCKGIVENLLDRLGVRNVLYKPAELSQFHPTRAAIIEASGARIGIIGEINSDLARQYDIPERTYAFELDFNQLVDQSSSAVTYKPLSRYPAVTRDLAVVVSTDVPYQRIEELLSKAAGELLESITLFDLYTGAPLQPGQKSLAFSVVFRSAERTLRDEEIDERLSEMRRLLTVELGASFRDT